MAKRRPKMPKLRPKIAKMTPKLTKMRPKMAKMTPKMANIMLGHSTPPKFEENYSLKVCKFKSWRGSWTDKYVCVYIRVYIYRKICVCGLPACSHVGSKGMSPVWMQNDLNPNAAFA